MTRADQIQRAHSFRRQHLEPALIILPNVWDALSARIVAMAGYSSLATASVATALISGYADGERIPFLKLMELVRQITDAVELPVSVDLEAGFAPDLDTLADNISALLDAGAIGLNIEDSYDSGLIALETQQKRLEIVRNTAEKAGIPLAINARTDVFLKLRNDPSAIPEAVKRIKAFADAGADCAYPIMTPDYNTIATLVTESPLPLNMFVTPAVNDLKRLEIMGVARVSVGPSLIKAAVTKIRDAAAALYAYDSSALFDPPVIANDDLSKLI